ncbi:serine protease [Limnoraphis robusta Tam1]|uniref:S1 family peptidase n=1 Tax=Limnoraphis robusta TaxID=1118279 RepID=UPI002B2147E4|nr:serine protease [Limnoraphis robusta]MEA5542987.1 serine protease [Limnoraphis robusta Tam1]
MSLFNRLSACILGMATALSVAIPTAFALTKQEVDAIAWQVSVILGPGLTKEQIKAVDKGDYNVVQGWENGSGVIVARQGNTYYALSALHVVADSRGGTFALATPDGTVHIIDDEKTKANIIPLGESQGFGESIDGLDLVLIKFNSNKNYPVASIASSENLEEGSPIFVNGWPNPEDLSITARVRRFEEGVVNFVANSPSANGGYSLLYSSWTASGMSGGPVFNSEGQVIGIHGRGRARGGVYCVNPQLSQNNSCGMQMLHFLGRREVARIKSALKTDPVEPRMVDYGRNNKSRIDRIDNIYRTFSVEEFNDAATRDIPSGGRCSVNLGDSECRYRF